MASRKLEVEIVGDARSLKNALSDSNSGLNRFGGALKSAAKAGALAAGAAGVGALFITLRQGISEFTQATKVAAQTNAVIKSTGGVAGVTAKHVDTLADSIMRKTGIDDEQIKSTENMLLAFTGIRNEVGKGNAIFDRATTIITDFSVRTGRDGVSSARLFGRALEDPIKGLGGLARAGVILSASQKKVIAGLAEAGDKAGAQRLILSELEKRYKGAGEAAGQTLPGQLNILKESFNNLAGDLVGKAMPAVTTFVTFLNEKGIPILGEAFGKIGEVVGPAIERLSESFKEAGPIITGVLEPLGNVIRDNLVPIFIQLQTIGTQALKAIGDVIRQNGPQIRQIFENLGTVIGNLAKIVIPLLKFALTEVLPVAVRILIPILTLLTTVLAKVSEAVRIVANVIQAVMIPAMRLVLTVAEALTRFLGGAFTKTLDAIGGPIKTAAVVLKNTLATAFDAVTTAAGKVREAFEWLKDNAVKIFNSIKGPLAKALAAITAPFEPLASVLERIIRAIDGVVGRVDDIVDAAGKIAGAAGGLLGKIPGLASGGPVEAGRAYMVGERGPELFIPGSKGMIIPNLSTPSTTRVGGGGGGMAVELNFYGPTNPRETEDWVRRVLYDVARRNPGTGL